VSGLRIVPLKVRVYEWKHRFTSALSYSLELNECINVLRKGKKVRLDRQIKGLFLQGGSDHLPPTSAEVKETGLYSRSPIRLYDVVLS
jgi:hypothetical protein